MIYDLLCHTKWCCVSLWLEICLNNTSLCETCWTQSCVTLQHIKGVRYNHRMGIFRGNLHLKLHHCSNFLLPFLLCPHDSWNFTPLHNFALIVNHNYSTMTATNVTHSKWNIYYQLASPLAELWKEEWIFSTTLDMLQKGQPWACLGWRCIIKAGGGIVGWPGGALPTCNLIDQSSNTLKY